VTVQLSTLKRKEYHDVYPSCRSDQQNGKSERPDSLSE
jgi:hypothetical protein